jgi:putative oxygen-independent coproporphyrinogen III oxidase
MDAARKGTASGSGARGAAGAPRSAYLHVPFCHRRCFYCDFPIVPLGDRADGSHSASIPAYLNLLLAEIAASPSGPPLSTIYLGGGTPSMLTDAQVAQLLRALERRYGLAPGAEISLELDPAGFDQPRLLGYLRAGINRVSLGGQSFDDTVLASLGRRHRAADLLEAASWLKEALHRGDLASWSLDLIQGLPQPLECGDLCGHWNGQLEEAMALEPPHLSIYDLIVEPGTVFARRQDRGDLALPEEELAADLMDLTWSRLTAGGYGHYEISNYALPGHASRHNRVYWSGSGWWGFGMGATSAVAGHRLARPRTRQGYAEWLQSQEFQAPERQELQEPNLSQMPLDERLMVGLRRREGVNMAAIRACYNLSAGRVQELRHRLQSFEREGLLVIEGPRWRLADPAGLALSNGVLRELLDWWECPASP